VKEPKIYEGASRHGKWEVAQPSVGATRECCRQLTGCTMLLSGGGVDQLALIQLTELHRAVQARAEESNRII